MKSLLWLLMPLAVYAQQEPPKGANTLVIATSLSDSLLYAKAGPVLIENGYAISRSNADAFLLHADTPKLKAVNIYPRLTIAIAQGKATITGVFGSTFDRLSDPANELTRIANTGGEKSPTKAAFELMKAYAHQLTQHTGGSLTYETNP